MALRKPHLWLYAALLIYFLYFFHLTATGMLGPDEPRYASIGREMARSGDWITPRLWGEPWFEKPALLYWMTGVAFRLGLGDDLAPRLPIAIVSVVFLVLFFRLLRQEFGELTAFYSTAILATSGGWIGLSHAGVPDVPFASAFTLAILLSLRWIRNGERSRLPYVAACLGLAVLAKGLLPLPLFLPVLWAARRRWADLLRPLFWGPFLAVSAPWYVLCFLNNGKPFLDEFFWRHHVERYVSNSLQHGQPFWFYAPVLLAGIFPWTPLAALVLRRKVRELGWVPLLVLGFGLIFFSASVNKLPEYLLPLVPSLAILMGLGLADLRDRTASWMLVLCGALAAMAPLLAEILPQALAGGISRSHMVPMGWVLVLQVILCLIVAILRPTPGVAAIATAVTACVTFLTIVSLPLVDQQVSARPLWRQLSSHRNQACVEQIHRRYRYGLNYYSVVPLPECTSVEKPLHVAQDPGAPPRIVQGLSPAPPTVP